MLFDINFDLIVSLGEDCACSSYLRRFRLQRYSYPFDWLTGASFSEKINLIINDFKNFISEEDLIIYPKKNPNTSNNQKFDLYENKRNGLLFFHDFSANIPFIDDYKNISEKYTRRIKRLYTNIDESDNILFVWWSKDKHQKIQNVLNGYNLLCKKFESKNIYILCIENSFDRKFINLNDDHIIMAYYDNSSYEQNPKWNKTMGNEKNNNMVFKQLKLKYSTKEKIEKYIFLVKKISVDLIPIKKIRKKLRDKIIFQYNHAKL